MNHLGQTEPLHHPNGNTISLRQSRDRSPRMQIKDFSLSKPGKTGLIASALCFEVKNDTDAPVHLVGWSAGFINADGMVIDANGRDMHRKIAIAPGAAQSIDVEDPDQLNALVCGKARAGVEAVVAATLYRRERIELPTVDVPADDSSASFSRTAPQDYAVAWASLMAHRRVQRSGQLIVEGVFGLENTLDTRLEFVEANIELLDAGGAPAKFAAASPSSLLEASVRPRGVGRIEVSLYGIDAAELGGVRMKGWLDVYVPVRSMAARARAQAK